MPICNVELSQHYASIKKILSKCEASNFVTNRQKCVTLLHILLQTCQGTYIILKDISVKSSTNPFSVLFSIPFSSPVRLLVIPLWPGYPAAFYPQTLHISPGYCPWFPDTAHKSWLLPMIHRYCQWFAPVVILCYIILS